MSYRKRKGVMPLYKVFNDKTVWPLYINYFEGNFFHLDFSENINISGKKQVQAARFSGKQYTLHCTLMDPPSTYKFIYHMSDDTPHDAACVDEVLRDIFVR